MTMLFCLNLHSMANNVVNVVQKQVASGVIRTFFSEKKKNCAVRIFMVKKYMGLFDLFLVDQAGFQKLILQ